MFQYFAYGSNLHPEQMSERCPSARLVGPARLMDFRLAFTRESKVTYPGSGVADVVAEPGLVVWGAVYSISDEDLRALDRIEGAGEAYDRKDVIVVGRESGEISAVTYSVTQKADNEIPPSTEYITRVIDGARACGLHRDYIAFLTSLRDPPARSAGA